MQVLDIAHGSKIDLREGHSSGKFSRIDRPDVFSLRNDKPAIFTVNNGKVLKINPLHQHHLVFPRPPLDADSPFNSLTGFTPTL